MARTHLHNPSQAEDTDRMLLGSKSGLVTYLKDEETTTQNIDLILS